MNRMKSKHAPTQRYTLVAGLALSSALVATLTTSRPATACTLDGKATAFADGSRAVLTSGSYTPAAGRIWAPFRFAPIYHARTAITLSEDRRALQRALPPEGLGRAWRWDLGDGARAVGWTVTHRYAHPGAYRITVSSYYPSWHQYFQFDSVRIMISNQ